MTLNGRAAGGRADGPKRAGGGRSDGRAERRADGNPKVTTDVPVAPTE